MFSKKVLCPECVKEGKKSTVRFGAGMSTLVYFPPYYDEDGNYHDDDHNKKTQEYYCSNGHRWTVQL